VSNFSTFYFEFSKLPIFEIKNSMKGIIISGALVVLAQISMGQSTVQESCVMTGEPAISATHLNKKTVVTGWYHYITDAAAAGVSWTRITNASLFPDTLVYQRYGGGATSTLGRVGTHSVGAVFDPKDIILANPQALTKFNPYKWDSLAIMFRYSHNVPNTVDTLLLCLYSGKNIIKGTLQGSGKKYATVGYDKVRNKGVNAFREIKIPIDQNDTTIFSNTADYNIKTIVIPGGFQIGADSLCAYTLSFIPGYAYNNGDTLQQDWEVPPVKKLNHFVYASWRDNSKLFNSGYNSGIKATTSSVLGTTWNGNYIAGHAWNDYDEHINSYYYITSNNLGVKELTKGITVYPNPVKQNENIKVSDNLNGKTCQVLDYTGKVVQQLEVENGNIKLQLPIGFYLLQLKDGDNVYQTKIAVQ
jgi:hypothetical protein